MNHVKKKQNKRSHVFIFCVCLFSVLFSGCKDETEAFIQETEQANTIETERISEAEEVFEPENTPIPEEIYVYVCGEVCAPGVVKLPGESRVFQAIEKAGGCTERAAENYINQAEKLEDGQQIYVPSIEETKQEEISVGMQKPNTADAVSEDGKVNINTADETQLTTLTGIGVTRAQAIIAYREAQGSFSAIEEIMNVQGIKEGTFEKIKDDISVE